MMFYKLNKDQIILGQEQLEEITAFANTSIASKGQVFFSPRPEQMDPHLVILHFAQFCQMVQRGQVIDLEELNSHQYFEFDEVSAFVGDRASPGWGDRRDTTVEYFNELPKHALAAFKKILKTSRDPRPDESKVMAILAVGLWGYVKADFAVKDEYFLEKEEKARDYISQGMDIGITQEILDDYDHPVGLEISKYFRYAFFECQRLDEYFHQAMHPGQKHKPGLPEYKDFENAVNERDAARTRLEDFLTKLEASIARFAMEQKEALVTAIGACPKPYKKGLVSRLSYYHPEYAKVEVSEDMMPSEETSRSSSSHADSVRISAKDRPDQSPGKGI